MKKGDILELQITDYAFEGKGIAKITFLQTALIQAIKLR
jgi:predicted RNA-binding protein with TRAM domain